MSYKNDEMDTILKDCTGNGLYFGKSDIVVNEEMKQKAKKLKNKFFVALAVVAGVYLIGRK